MSKFLISFKYTLSAFALILLVGLSTVVFGEANNAENQDIAENASDCKMKAYTDPQALAAAMANPTEFMQIIALMSNPQTAQSMMECGMDSKQWNEIMANMTNPASMMAASGQFMNPQMYMNWMTAMMNPAFYQTTMNAYMNPALYNQWMTTMMNPAFYSAPMAKMADPKWQQESTAWMMNPANFQKMFEGMYNTAPVVADATSAK
ncbi:MAG: hypothetical protein GKR92_03160 [Gammaproteobacteria bacterium]|nr:MAG: hypothetical protein GKR92_03160 [Gammaproteobacteria bacterium]